MIRERVRRSVNNASELRELLLELLATDEELADMLRGPPVSVGSDASRWACSGYVQIKVMVMGSIVTSYIVHNHKSW